jgi:hypothetical protein
VFNDFAFKFSKRMARLFLRWSDYWGDIAEAIHSGEAVSEVKKRRKNGE